MTTLQTKKTQIKAYLRNSQLDYTLSLSDMYKKYPKVSVGVIRQAKNGYELSKSNTSFFNQISKPVISSKPTSKPKPKKTTPKPKTKPKKTTPKPKKTTQPKPKPTQTTQTTPKKTKDEKNTEKLLKLKLGTEIEKVKKFNEQLKPYGHKVRKKKQKDLLKYRKDYYHLWEGRLQQMPPKPNISKLRIRDIWQIKGATSKSLQEVIVKAKLVLYDTVYGDVIVWMSGSSGSASSIPIQKLYDTAYKELEDIVNNKKYEFVVLKVDMKILRIV